MDLIIATGRYPSIVRDLRDNPRPFGLPQPNIAQPLYNYLYLQNYLCIYCLNIVKTGHHIHLEKNI